MRIPSTSLLAALCLVAACTSSGGSPPDARPDAPADAPADARPDTAPDSGDAARDVGPDAIADATTDATPADRAEASSDLAADRGEAGTACAACGADELCVVSFDGTCHQLAARCAKKTAGCQTAACNTACNRDLCGVPDGGPIAFTCQSAACPGSNQFPGAMLCYGP
jgi:hypothetical protein